MSIIQQSHICPNSTYPPRGSWSPPLYSPDWPLWKLTSPFVLGELAATRGGGGGERASGIHSPLPPLPFPSTQALAQAGSRVEGCIKVVKDQGGAGGIRDLIINNQYFAPAMTKCSPLIFAPAKSTGDLAGGRRLRSRTLFQIPGPNPDSLTPHPSPHSQSLWGGGRGLSPHGVRNPAPPPHSLSFPDKPMTWFLSRGAFKVAKDQGGAWGHPSNPNPPSDSPADTSHGSSWSTRDDTTLGSLLKSHTDPQPALLWAGSCSSCLNAIFIPNLHYLPFLFENLLFV